MFLSIFKTKKQWLLPAGDWSEDREGMQNKEGREKLDWNQLQMHEEIGAMLLKDRCTREFKA